MKYAKEHGFPNPKFYVDDGYTGTNFDRPSFKETSADIRLFCNIYEDNVNGKLNDGRFYKLSDGYEAEQEHLKLGNRRLDSRGQQSRHRSG
jgi:hypothetical protein